MTWGETLLFQACLGAVAVTLAASARAAPAADPRLRADLEALARRTVYFGHQSVGGNILDGVRELAAQAGVTVRIAEVAAAAAVTPGTCGHGLIAENGNPALKIRSFEEALASGGEAVDIALMKFCYVDFHRGTDPVELFERYRAALGQLRQRHPRTVFAHVTVPLTVPGGGAWAALRSLLGRDTADAQNARRAVYNDLMRRAYRGKEPLFDLAQAESTGPDGRASTSTWKGRTVPSLCREYTDDGGHLGAEGRRRVAREFVAFLASIPLAGSAAPPP